VWRCLRDDTTARMQPPPLERKNVEENVEETVDEGVPAPGKLQTEPARRFAASTDRSAAAICQTWWSACDAKSGDELDGEVCSEGAASGRPASAPAAPPLTLWLLLSSSS